jgi:hypothetical protein
MTPNLKVELSHLPGHVRISVLTPVKHQILIILAWLFKTTEFKNTLRHQINICVYWLSNQLIKASVAL